MMKTKTLLAAALSALFLSLGAATVNAANLYHGDSTGALNVPGSWFTDANLTTSNANTISSNDILVFNEKMLTARSMAIGGSLSIAGLDFSSAIKTHTITGNNSNTLTIGAEGLKVTGKGGSYGTAVNPDSAYGGFKIGGTGTNAGIQVNLIADQVWDSSYNPSKGTTVGQDYHGYKDAASFFGTGSSRTTGLDFNLGGNTVTKAGTGSIQVSSYGSVSSGNFLINDGVICIQNAGGTAATVVSTNFTVNRGSLPSVPATLLLQVNSGVKSSDGGYDATWMGGYKKGVVLSGNTTLNGGRLWLFTNSGDGSAVITGGITLKAKSEIQVGANTGVNGALITGNITQSGGNFGLDIYTGAGDLALEGTNSYKGLTLLKGNSAGTIYVSGDSSAADGGWALTSGNSNQNVVVGATAVTGRAYANATIGLAAGKSIENAAGKFTLNGGKIQLNGNTANAFIGNGTFALGGLGGTINTNGFDTTIGVNISNAAGATGSLTKSGAGTLTLTGTNTYTGETNVTGGTLALDGATVAGAVTINTGTMLKGTGTIKGNLLASGGVIDIGFSPGTLTVQGNADLTNATVKVEYSGAGQVDFLLLEGAVTVSGTILQFIDASGLTVGTVYELFGATNSLSIADVATGITVQGLDGFTYEWVNASGSGAALSITSVPEPSTYALFGGIAAAGIALAVRRRRKA